MKHKDLIPGGLADKKQPADFKSSSLKAGVKVETEHTSSRAIATEIAMDHLSEDPNYYEKLKKMEKKAMAFEDGFNKVAGVKMFASAVPATKGFFQRPTGEFKYSLKAKGPKGPTTVDVVHPKPKMTSEEAKKLLPEGHSLS